MAVTISVSWGEFIDRLTILEIKAQNIPDPDDIRPVDEQLAQYRAVLEEQLLVPDCAEKRDRLMELKSKLTQSNRRIWDAVNAVHEHINSQDLGPDFVNVAQLIHTENDLRSSLKREVDQVMESHIHEVKYHETPLVVPMRSTAKGNGRYAK